LPEFRFVTRNVQIDGIVAEEIHSAGEVKGGVLQFYFAQRDTQEFGALVVRQLDIRLHVLVPEESSVAGAGKVEGQAAFAVGADLTVIITEGRLDPRDVRFYTLPALRVVFVVVSGAIFTASTIFSSPMLSCIRSRCPFFSRITLT